MTSLAEAIDRIPAGGRIIAGSCCGGPTSLLRVLAERAAGRRWQLWTGLLLDDGGIYAAVGSGEIQLVTWHVAPAGRELAKQGLVEYLPVRASQLEKHIAEADVDAVLARVTPPDSDGWCSLGPSASYMLTAINAARMCIAEVDEALPRTWGNSRVHVSELDVLVPASAPTPTYRASEPDGVSRAIARNILSLLPDRPVLQLGIGGATEALVPALAEAGVHGMRFVGMGMDGMVELFERGLLDHDSGIGPAIESPELVGTSRLMRFAHENPAVGVFPSSVAHSPLRLARYERLVSVNTAIEIDVSGQVNSEVVAGRQISGIGGSLDFIEAATHAQGGTRIIALPSTTRDGGRSRIVPRFDANTAVTIPRGMVDVVVTEHGVARLEGKTLRERAEALAAIAAPQHTGALADVVGGCAAGN